MRLIEGYTYYIHLRELNHQTEDSLSSVESNLTCIGVAI